MRRDGPPVGRSPVEPSDAPGQDEVRGQQEVPGQREVPSQGEVPGHGEAPERDRPAVVVAVGIGLALLAAVLAWTAVLRAPQISILDEITHADYAWQVSHGHLPARGSVVAPEILAEVSCHGPAVARPLPPCGQQNPPPAGYPFRGEDYSFGHPPLYYAITGLLTRGIDALVPGRHFITIARLTGVLWLWAAMLTLYLALRRFGAPGRFAALGAALLPLCPGVLHASSTVSNDAPAALAGGLALLLLARVVVRERTGWLLPTAVAGLAAATKVISALPFLGLVVVFAVLAVGRWRRGERAAARSLLAAAGGIGVAVLSVYAGWTLLQAGRGVADWISPVAGLHDRPINGLPLDELLSTSFTGFPLQSGYFLQPAIDGEAVMLWARALTVALIAAPFLALVAFARRSAGWLVGAATLGGVLAYPLVVELQVYVADGRYFLAVTTRYGMSMVPWALACLVLVAWHRGTPRLAAAGTAVGAVAMVSTVTGLV